MGLEIKQEHLQFAFFLLNFPKVPPQTFFENADVFFHLFTNFDVKTAAYIKMTTGKTCNEPPYFGQKILEFAQQDYVTGQGAFIPRVTESSELDAGTKEELRRSMTNLFLNLAAWYVIPLAAANGGISPYMPRSWIEKFIEEKQALSEEQRAEYFAGVIRFLEQMPVRTWILPYWNLSGRLGKMGQDSLLLIIGMFREMAETRSAQRSLPAPSPTKPVLNDEIMKFIEGLDVDDLTDKKDK